MKLRVSGRVRCDEAAIRWIVRSPDGTRLAVASDRSTAYSPTASTTHGLVRVAGGWEKTVSAAVPAAHVFALDDGALVLVTPDFTEIAISRVTAGAIARWAIRGLSLSDVEVGLRSPHELIVRATDRDDGHGYTDPVYTPIDQVVDLRSGKLAEAASGSSSLLRGPGTPLLSPVSNPAIAGCVGALPWRREWPICVGPTRLLTTARLIAWQTRTDLLGAPETAARAWYPIFDLSPDEQRVAGRDVPGALRIWQDGVMTSIDLAGEARCAAFLDSETVAAGTAAGDVVFVSIE